MLDSSTNIELFDIAPATKSVNVDSNTVVEFYASSKLLPLFSKRNIMAKNINKFKDNFLQFFSTCSIAEGQHFEHIKYRSYSNAIKIWINKNEATLAPMTFVNFIEAYES